MKPAAYSTLLLVSFALGPLAAQQRLAQVNTETPEGQLLQQAGQENDPAKKAALFEDFVAKHGNHEAALWVYSQMQDLYLKANQFDKALEAGEKIAAKDPKDLHAQHSTLRAAEGKKDPGLVLKWSASTSQLARAVAGGTKPADMEDDDWKARVTYAKQVDTYAEYSVFAMILQTTDPAKRVELINGLRSGFPNSQYLPKLNDIEFNAYRQLQNNAQAIATAERVVATDQTSEDMLILLADYYMQQKREPDKVIAYSQKVVELMGSKPKPEGMADGDWENKKKTLSGLASFLAGSTYFNQKKLKPAEEAFRAALPNVDANEQLRAAVLFYLGLSNYQLGKKKEALAFNEQCAKIKSPFQAKAADNVRLIRAGK
ncbi:MAG: tetratricopeptide repeat protein [Bryobacteraceae bacterium]